MLTNVLTAFCSAAVIHTDDIIHGNLLKQTQALIGRNVYFCVFVRTCYHGYGVWVALYV